jgi:hypothetical protein
LDQIRKHFLSVTYGCGKISWRILKALHASIGAMDKGAAYFARAVSYGRKMFMKLTARRKVLLHRHLVDVPADQKIWVAICSFR